MAKSMRKTAKDDIGLAAEEILQDYTIAFKSRQASLIGRKEVLTGKAKFGIFGDGKEVAQLAMARAFRHGDWRSGYYRDQTFMFALNASDTRKFFAQLYADTDIGREPASGGRQMNSHFATRYLDNKGQWLNQLMMFNTSADASPTACQMGRAIGLAYASKLYREIPGLAANSQFSINGNEVAFVTIGNASTSEGIFWECLNAAGVLQSPLVISVWDDEYGISVPAKFQTTKESISAICAGFQQEDGSNGLDVYQVQGWNYYELVQTYLKAADTARKTHRPALIHVIEMTQPQGHSTSGSHERYKSADRLRYEDDRDCLKRMRAWILEQKLSTEDALTAIEKKAATEVEYDRKAAWDDYLEPILQERSTLASLLEHAESTYPELSTLRQPLLRAPTVNRKLIASTARRALWLTRTQDSDARQTLVRFAQSYKEENAARYNSFLMSESVTSPMHQKTLPAQISESGEKVDGRVIIQRIFDHHIARDPRMFIIGEDVGKLGGVNLEFEGLSDKHGDWRVTDTGIREATILGQGLGAAMRGLRPIVDIQYLDYLLYAFQLMSDDLATLHYRSAGGQIAPVIVRTKGHRLEGIWHSGSPMGMIIHGIRGMHVCVPRNMTQAAGFYNTLLKGDDPALVIEVLNGYRVKETVPDNLTEFQLALGEPEILQEGTDVTIVTYGACVRVAQEACEQLQAMGVSVELIDVQTLLPFDRPGTIAKSITKTNAVLFFDEDVPGGATAYMMQQVLERHGAYENLDALPRTLTAKAHRSPYGTDGDYFTKPSVEDVVETIYELMHERNPELYVSL